LSHLPERLPSSQCEFSEYIDLSLLIPSIAEMKNPKEYKKPIAASMGLLNVCYIIVSLVVYKYCGSAFSQLDPPVTLADGSLYC